MYIKRFSDWILIKERINKEERVDSQNKDVVRKGEIRWATVGVNIGREMDGKGENFARPVFVIHTIGDSLALIIPMTSKNKNLPGYIKFQWKDKIDSLCIHQMRIVSTKRLLKRIAKVSDKKISNIKKEIKSFYNF